MELLSYKTLEEQKYNGYLLKEAPEKVLQFGEGNFLRAFVDYFFDRMNEEADFNGKVCVTQPIGQGLGDMMNAQDCLYTLFLRGSENGQKVNNKRVISALSRCLNPYKDYQELMDCAKIPICGLSYPTRRKRALPTILPVKRMMRPWRASWRN